MSKDDYFNQLMALEPDNYTEAFFSGRAGVDILLKAEIDWEMQLHAIKCVLKRNKEFDDDLKQDLQSEKDKLDDYKGSNIENLVDSYQHSIYVSYYHDLARSMSFVSMVVPFIESILQRCFKTLGSMYDKSKLAPPSHVRWLAKNPNHKWDCSYKIKSNGSSDKGFAKGTKQIFEAIELAPPENFLNLLGALVEYRNLMFHQGFEWDRKTGERFFGLLKSNKWERYFIVGSSSGNKVFLINDNAIDEVIETIETLLDSLAEFARQQPWELTSAE